MGDLKPGDLVFLTEAYERFVKSKNPNICIRLVNRLAKLEEIIDWESPKGKTIMEARLSSKKWDGLPMEDNKYILSVYYHDLIGRKGEDGVVERGVPFFRKDPKTGELFFVKVPDWIFKEIMKKCETFDVQAR